MKDAAKVLQIAHRTIETYMVNIRAKSMFIPEEKIKAALLLSFQLDCLADQHGVRPRFG